MYSGGDVGNIGVVAHLPVNLGEDVAVTTPCEGKVDVGDTHSGDAVALKLLLDIALRPGLAHPYSGP